MLVFQRVNAKRGCIKVRFSLKAQIVRPVFRIFQQLAAGEAARPAVFIVAPRLHPALFRLVNGCLHRTKPVLAQILGFKSAPRVHKESAHARVLHRTDLPPQLVRL